MLTKVAKEKALPFEMRVPNKLTKSTMLKTASGVETYQAKDADDLFNQLGL